MVAAGEIGAGAGLAVSDRAGRGGRAVEHLDRRAAGLSPGDGRQVAIPVRAGGPGRAGRRAPTRRPTEDRRRAGRSGRGGHTGADPDRCHALVAGIDGRRQRPVEIHGRADLEDLRAQAASPRHVQAVHRPAVHRQGPRHRRSLSRPAGEGAGAMRRREEPDPGVGPLGAGVADDAGHARAAHPRLRPPRHHHPVRRTGRGHRRGDRLDPPPPPRRGVPQVPDQVGQAGAVSVGRAPDLRQLQHPQGAHDPGLASRASAFPHALHPDLLVLAQPGRTLVRASTRRSTARMRSWPPTTAPWSTRPGPPSPRTSRRESGRCRMCATRSGAGGSSPR